jgi:hypothetical protein
VSDQAGPGSKNGFIIQVIGNTSLLAAILIYTGWSWLNAQLEYFRLSPIALNVSNLDYILHGTFLFIPNIIFVVALLVLVIVLFSRAPKVARFAPRFINRAAGGISRNGLRVGLALLMTIGAGFLAWSGEHGNAYMLGLSSWAANDTALFCVVIILFGIGPLLLVWPDRSRGYGRFLYPVAIVIAASCAIWAAGVYAANTGAKAAEYDAVNYYALPAVALYSSQQLDISGPGVTVQALPASSPYHYRYLGLRILYTESGTYYLLPVGWNLQSGSIYILNDNDQISIVVYTGAPPQLPVTQIQG